MSSPFEIRLNDAKHAIKTLSIIMQWYNTFGVETPQSKRLKSIFSSINNGFSVCWLVNQPGKMNERGIVPLALKGGEIVIQAADVVRALDEMNLMKLPPHYFKLINATSAVFLIGISAKKLHENYQKGHKVGSYKNEAEAVKNLFRGVIGVCYLNLLMRDQKTNPRIFTLITTIEESPWALTRFNFGNYFA